VTLWLCNTTAKPPNEGLCSWAPENHCVTPKEGWVPLMRNPGLHHQLCSYDANIFQTHNYSRLWLIHPSWDQQHWKSCAKWFVVCLGGNVFLWWPATCAFRALSISIFSSAVLSSCNTNRRRHSLISAADGLFNQIVASHQSTCTRPIVVHSKNSLNAWGISGWSSVWFLTSFYNRK